MKEAMFYVSLPGGEVRCNLCKHRCKIKEGKRGNGKILQRDLRSASEAGA